MTLFVCANVVYAVNLVFSQGTFSSQVKDSHGTILAISGLTKGKWTAARLQAEGQEITMSVDLQTMKADVDFRAFGNAVKARGLQCTWAGN